MKFLVFSLLVLGMGLVSCGKENPLDGKNLGVTQAIPPSGEQKPQSVRADFLKVTPSEVEFNYYEGQSAQYVITGSSTEPTAQFMLQIVNMDEFPGATFNPGTGVFDWKPSADFLTDFKPRRLYLQARISTTNITPNNFSNDLNIPVIVSPGDKVPEVLSIKFPGESTVREGDSINFDVQVHDVTGIDADKNRPTIAITFDQYDQTGASDISSIMKLRDVKDANDKVLPNPTQDLTDPSLWTFHVMANLSKQEITNSTMNLHFAVTAISRFKVTSLPKSGMIRVNTSLKDPVISWSLPQEMKAGQKNSFTFMVFDPRNEGDVQFKMVSLCGQIHPNLRCGACAAANDRDFGPVLYCPVTWDIPADYFSNDGAKMVTLEMQAFLKSRLDGDKYTSPLVNFKRQIKILPADVAPTPAPSPSPSPSPTPVPVRGN